MVRVKKLALRNFRNVEECSFTPDPGINFLVGSNGQGKTSFLEALSYLSTLRSFRGAKNDEVIRWDQTSSEVSCVLSLEGPGEPNEPPAQDLEQSSWKTDLKLVFAYELDGLGRQTTRA